MNVVAYDPGETTGYVLVDIDIEPFEYTLALLAGHSPQDVESPIGRHVTTVEYGGLSGIGELYAHDSLYKDIDTCVVEDYRIYPNRVQSHIGSRVYTLREIGRIEMLMFEHSGLVETKHERGSRVRGVVFQAASMAKQAWPNSRLYDGIGRLKCWKDLRGKLMDDIRKTEHLKDAFRHLLTYLERAYGAI